ncbi:MAG TPA: hypothetical protein VND23_07715 [Acidimicrobiales bacterium]|nr:hypothetical protein [Acidimicrobiales bacterium]
MNAGAWVKSTIANFWPGWALAAVCVALAMSKPTVMMVPHSFAMSASIFGVWSPVEVDGT